MKTGQTIGIVIGTILVVLLAVTTLLPKEVPHTYEKHLCAPGSVSFAQFHDLEEMVKWSRLLGAPGGEREFDGRSGEGASLRLVDGNERWFSLTITESRPQERLSYHFHTHDDLNTRVRVNFEAMGDDTRLTVRLVQEFGTLFGRWAIVFVRSALDDFIVREMESLEAHLQEAGFACGD
ncbi:SRPBCC family protein [Natronospira bacteriovora]|uniref:SRPBCC domain-containing protein n=1 Tax=Natronospira bacteriovora TaxID=3069753 RepID=A0ABU0W7I3_9GAMM|nr:SRPBCC domain-containing protein [Natronospira sp. AB-CW4]MDQ2069972.1 SRPBCC domain-containing protein [Natronospira sp. AB-CW4]